jgi:hypothetical protein
MRESVHANLWNRLNASDPAVFSTLSVRVFFFSLLGFLTKIYPGFSLVPLSLLETS